MRRSIIIVVLLAALLATTGFVVLSQWTGDASAKKGDPEPDRVVTADVKQGNMTSLTRAQGVLTYEGSRPLVPALSGILTALPAPGTTVTQGKPLYWLNNIPVMLLHGALPAWREFKSDMTSGPDVMQLESSLQQMGFFHAVPDEYFDWNTKFAIQNWQKSLDLEQTGSLELGRVQFLPGDLRIASSELRVGDQIGAGSTLMTVTSTQKVVTANLQAAEQSAGRPGASVVVNLPDKTQLPGKIKEAGAPKEIEENSEKKIVVPIIVTLDDPAAAGGLEGVSVSVSIEQVSRENAISVPVGALMAIAGGHFGVQVVSEAGTKLVEVTTGAFVNGSVEITGGDLHVGDKVVVAV